MLEELFSRKSYAASFKDAYENQDDLKLVSVLEDWDKNGNHDATFSLAVIIGGLRTQSLKSTDAFEMYMEAIKLDVVDSSLFNWYNARAIELMEKQVDDEIGFSEMFNNKYKSNVPSNGYAKEFLDCFEDVLDGEEDLNGLKEILSGWQENSPEDANMHCAYVIVNIAGMSGDELKDRQAKAKECIPVDKNEYPKFLALMNGVCKARC